MVSPINYSMNVLNPIEGYMQGLKFGENILTQRQGRELAQSQEGRAQEQFALAKEDRARAIQQQQATAAQAQAKREQAARGQQALLEYLDKQEAGTATASDLRRALVQFPEVSERFQSVAKSFTEERLGNETRYGQQLAFALGRKNTDAAKNLIQERLNAAKAANDDRGAAAYQSKLQMLETSPEALLTETLMPLVTMMGVDDFNKFHDLAFGGGDPDQPAEVLELQFRAEAAGFVPGTTEYQDFMRTGGAVPPVKKLGFRTATAEEAAAAGATSGQIDQDTNRFYPFTPPKGMTLTVDKDGNISFVEGAVAGANETGKKSPDFVYTIDPETGQEIAQPIAGTPAALENEQRRSSVLSSIDTAKTMLTTIESLVGREAKEGQTAIKAPEALSGILGLLEGNFPPKTQAQADLMAIYEQVTGQAFLDAFESLKGSGQITETEGIKATKARARLQRTQSPEAFKESLYEFSDIVRRGLKRAESELRTISDIVPAPSSAPSIAVPNSFTADPSVISTLEGTVITPEELWNAMSPEAKAKYGN